MRVHRQLTGYAESAAQVALPLAARRQGLGPGMPVALTAAEIDRYGEAPTEAARQFRGLVENALLQSYAVQGNRNEDIRQWRCSRGNVIRQQVSQQRGDGQFTGEFQPLNQVVDRCAVVQHGGGRVESGRLLQAGAAQRGIHSGRQGACAPRATAPQPGQVIHAGPAQGGVCGRHRTAEPAAGRKKQGT